ncbi:L-aspartate oxidase [Kordiimonas sp. SCSIO 12603]|uniref:L-aspartate oxidase n=1 Tax=Kordiimonas sp. SCSIO 12603 TaxID=2829596 RepID=UPI002103F36A|nr:L-aspartate oxidase [Kordiimonas sp. SCSIO 12603]UTW59283.1 L-aspartate oxidase [Kordiimonas sp. SCSIO 12603]
MKHIYDVVIAGTGAAGLTAALKLAPHMKVAVLSKGPMSGGSTRWAQGGIAAVLEATDSIQSHIDDTLVAGAGLCNEEAVRFVVERGREAIEGLIDLGVEFDRANQAHEDGYDYHLTREGGHSHRRIIHAADATGKAVQKTLNEQVLAHPNIDIYEYHVAVDVITNRHLEKQGGYTDQAHGLYVLNLKTGGVETFSARSTILATGGASRVYLYSSNPDASTGDGIAMAWRAGCRVTNMEFNQFHPTCLYHPDAKTFLITEAMRGEGAVLRGKDGERFMPKYDERAELAPRDIVARAIDSEMKRTGVDNVWLDITHKDADFVISHFPNIYRYCQSLGIDITSDLIPVVPAAHYTCGGIHIDMKSRTDLSQLYAIGECAHTGLHGANRMASNSLLECLVMGNAAADDILENAADLQAPAIVRPWDESQVTDSDEEVVVSHNWKELRRFMWDYVGIVRTDKRLARAKRRVDLLAAEIQEYYGNFRVTADLLELRNLVTVADLIVRSAQMRKESRGLHYTPDYPELAEGSYETTLIPFSRTVSDRVA